MIVTYTDSPTANFFLRTRQVMNEIKTIITGMNDLRDLAFHFVFLDISAGSNMAMEMKMEMAMAMVSKICDEHTHGAHQRPYRQWSFQTSPRKG